MSDVTPIPKFARPPVVETILGVYFRPIAALRVTGPAVLWDRSLREEFPSVEQRPAVEFVPERFGGAMALEAIRFQLSDAPPPARLWMQTRDGRHVLQLQSDALLTNWLRRESGGDYLSFDERRSDFHRRLEQLDAFVRSTSGEAIMPLSATVTYINHVTAEEGASSAEMVASLLAGWSGRTSDDRLPRADAVKVNASFPFEAHGGRLHLNLFPAVRSPERKSILRMELLGRANCREGDGIEGAMRQLDLCHDWVVRGFASLTTAEMHEKWGRGR